MGLGHRVAKKDVPNVLIGVPNNNIFEFTILPNFSFLV